MKKLIIILSALFFVGCDYDESRPYVKAGNMLYPNLGEGGYYCTLGMVQDPDGRTVTDDDGKPIPCTIIFLTTEQLINY